jgi:hypothetical protein
VTDTPIGGGGGGFQTTENTKILNCTISPWAGPNPGRTGACQTVVLKGTAGPYDIAVRPQGAMTETSAATLRGPCAALSATSEDLRFPSVLRNVF